MKNILAIIFIAYSCNIFSASYGYTLQCEKNAAIFLYTSKRTCDSIPLESLSNFERNSQCMINLFQQYSNMACTNTSKVTGNNIIFLWRQLIQSINDFKEKRISQKQLDEQIETIYPKTSDLVGLIIQGTNAELDDIQVSEARARSFDFAAKTLRDLGAIPQQSNTTSPIQIYNFNGRSMTCVTTGISTSCN